MRQAVLDFFISYTRSDQPWAEWIARVLDEAGYQTRLQARDFIPGGDFVHEMQQAAATADRTIAVLSPAYFASRYTGSEWGAAFAQDPTGEAARLLPVRVAKVEPPGLLRSRVYIDLVGKNEAEARSALLDGVAASGAQPTRSAPFPGQALEPAAEPVRFPGVLPAVWNVPFRRNLQFTGRTEQLGRIHQQLISAGQLVPLVLVGPPGVGKTQLAAEYAYRHSSEYDLVWWIRADDAGTLLADFAALAEQLAGLPVEKNQTLTIAAVRTRLETSHRWLLVFDNLDEAELLEPVAPQAGGHVLVTSRSDLDWAHLATMIAVDPLPTEEAQAFLVARSRQEDQEAAAKLAEALGGLPLALEQAAGYIAHTGIVTLDRYLELFEQQSLALLERGRRPRDYQSTVAATWELSLERLGQIAPAAVELLSLAAFLAPDDLPATLLLDHADLLSGGLGAAAQQLDSLGEAVAALRRFGLVKRSGDGLFIHRLLQTSVRDRLAEGTRRAWAALAVRLLRASFPDHGEDVRTWEECRRLLPHALRATEHAERLNVELKATSWLLDRVARYAKGKAQLAEAKEYLDRAVALAEQALGEGHAEVANIRSDLGIVLSGLGSHSAARAQDERALAIRQTTLGPEHPETALSHDNLSGTLHSLGDYAAARAHAERALAIRQATLGAEHPDTARSHANLSSTLQALGDYAAARVQAERALAIRQAALGPEHFDTALSHDNLSGTLHSLGDYAGARTQAERALAIRQAALGPEHFDTALSHDNLSGTLHSLGDYAGARTQAERALAIRQTTLGPEHPDAALSHDALAGASEALGDYAGARVHAERGLAIRQATLGAEHPDTARSHDTLAGALLAQGNLAGGRVQAERALAIRQATLGPDHPETARSHANLAGALLAQGNLAGARLQIERAVAIRQATLGPDHPETARSHANLGRVLRRLGKRGPAQRELAHALDIMERTLGSAHRETQGIRTELVALRAKGRKVPRRGRRR
jgi:tetratricopeptide (TPR) repeat protein